MRSAVRCDGDDCQPWRTPAAAAASVARGAGACGCVDGAVHGVLGRTGACGAVIIGIAGAGALGGRAVLGGACATVAASA